MSISTKSYKGIAIAAALALALTACASETEPTGAPSASQEAEPDLAEVQLSGDLTGAGASFPNPVFQEYQFSYSTFVQPGVSVNYQSIGSGGGIEQFLLQSIDFGSSEKFLDDEALAQAAEGRGCEAVQFPVLFGAVTVAFGDPQFEGLKLTPEVIADIFQRNITNYNDPAIVALNPDRTLPDLDIIPVHRSDGSGTTNVFTIFLDDAADNWELGKGTEVQWPSGTIGGQGNEGVTAGIQQNAGGLGYVNQAYALVNELPTAAIENADGNFVQATIEATVEALEVLEIPDSFQFAILGVGGNGFPIAGANWVFVYECGYEDNTAAMMKDYLTWITTSSEAASLAQRLGYATLGESLQARVLTQIDRINSK